jgi:hypothetical protein
MQIISAPNVLSINRDAGFSMKYVGEELNVSHMIIWRALHEQLLNHFHLQRVQPLMFADFSARRKFYRCSVKSCALLSSFSALYR